ncbi:MAG: hypothetical protein Q9M09_01005 [Mariprofundaceae bacterium]|nr:hypothetical protein [Mariprofundaceae bacterium]
MDVNKFTSVWDIGQMKVGDLISNPFDAIKAALFDYKSHPEPDKEKELRMMVQGYLKEMNGNANMPFSHRLRVMDTLGSYINILQVIAVPNLLESYDKVIVPVAKKAAKEPIFAEALVELTAIAYRLIISDLQRTLARYHPISAVSVRRALSYMHTVVTIFRQHQLPSNPWFSRLSQLYVVHELLRTVNTYAMTTHHQKSAMTQLRKHMESGLPVHLSYFSEGDRIQYQGLALMTNPQKPHETPRRALRYDECAAHDVILLDLDALAQKSLAEMRHAKAKMGPQQQGQHGDYVMVADAFHDAIALGEMMREIMFTRPRKFVRQRPKGKRSLALDTDIHQGLKSLYSQQRNLDMGDCMLMPEKHKIWQVVDISEGGFYIEQMHIEHRAKQLFSTQQDDGKEPQKMEVGILIAYSLITPAEAELGGQPQAHLIDSGLARSSWFRVSSSEIKSVGLAKVLGGEVVFVRIMRELLSTTASNKFHGWLQIENDKQLHLWSTQDHLASGAPLMLRTVKGLTRPCTIVKMIECGVNYVVHLCVLNEEGDSE